MLSGDAFILFVKEGKNVELVKKAFKIFWKGLLLFIDTSPGWMVLLMILVVRVFMVRPLGAFAGLGIGVYWIIMNKTGLRWRKISLHFMSVFFGYPSYSLWYEHVGKNQIEDVIRNKSSIGISCCNLTDELNMPPFNQYRAICIKLNEMGIRTQVAKDYFIIAWSPEEYAAA